jgi:hypothetical protein
MARKTPISPDSICREFADTSKDQKLILKIDEVEKMVVFEGSAETLEFIGNLFLAQARFEKDCSFFLGPKGPGNLFFDKTRSTHGIYIQRSSCDN